MPSVRDGNGIHRDIYHPITPELREAINTAVIDAYERAVDNLG